MVIIKITFPENFWESKQLKVQEIIRELIQVISIAAQDSESEAAIENAKTTRLLAKRELNYIFYAVMIMCLKGHNWFQA